MDWLLWLGLAAVVARSSGQGVFQGGSALDSSTDATFCGNVSLTCEETRYRSADGSCNNLEHSWWGTPYSPYTRLLCNSDSCGVEAIHNEKLPNPRTISQRLIVDLDVKDPLWTLLFMQYGQIIAHDLSLTAGVAPTKKGAVSCCSADGKMIPEAESNPRCAPILIPKQDPFNAPEGITCMDFFRVETTKDGKNCTNPTDEAHPLTQVTAYLDVSYLYGSDEATAKKVREGKGGRLAHVIKNKKMFLPQNPEPELACNVDSKTEPCYFTGDARVNQNPELALEHNIYMAHHNMIADKFATLNPFWDDETIFQETKRAVVAIHQWITYNEFLTGLLEEDFMVKNKMYYPKATGYINDYDPSVNPGVSNEFAACGFRMLHTAIMGTLSLVKENRNTSSTMKLDNHFNKPLVCEEEHNYDDMMRGMATQPQSAIDRFMPIAVTNLLFKTGLLGQDLKAIDIQRGRDQRVCSYTNALRAFGMSDPKSFEDLTEFIKPEIVAILEDMYESFEDIDLCTGIMVEKKNALVSPLVQHIIGEQFYRSRVGDRFFFENGIGKSAFTIDQLNEIRRQTIAGILCINENIKQMQSEAFKLISERNPLKSCLTDIPKFNPLPWKATNI